MKRRQTRFSLYIHTHLVLSLSVSCVLIFLKNTHENSFYFRVFKWRPIHPFYRQKRWAVHGSWGWFKEVTRGWEVIGSYFKKTTITSLNLSSYPRLKWPKMVAQNCLKQVFNCWPIMEPKSVKPKQDLASVPELASLQDSKLSISYSRSWVKLPWAKKVKTLAHMELEPKTSSKLS